ncbi:TPA: tyrosine-type recombinase/integrase [Streptococcus suis]
MKYGFKWNKNVVPHSFRHIHISALRNNNDVPLKEIQLRVGHVEVETTNGYTHLEVGTQEKSVQAITTYFNKLDFAQ